MSYLLERLNKEQQKAVAHTSGPLLVVAGAGTGKTRTLTHRIAYLISQGVQPSAILAVTFTNKAAGEMRERIEELLSPYYSNHGGKTPYSYQNQPMVKTFHSLGVYLLRAHSEVLGIKKSFSILDRDDSLKLIRHACNDLGIDTKKWDPKNIWGTINKSRMQDVSVSEFEGHSEQGNIAKKIWERYEQLKRESHSLDFDDLLTQTYNLLSKYSDILKHYQDRWHYIHVDEYQDTNDIQYKIIKLLVGDRLNICAVGDGDQTIYTWRGATMRNIMQFEKDYPHATVVFLEENYRSTDTILEAADHIINKNTVRIPKKLRGNLMKGEKISLSAGMSGKQEALFVGSTIRSLIDDKKTEPRDIAILYRTNFQSRVLEEAMLEYHIPYTVTGTKFFDRKEVKDVLAYLQAARNPASIVERSRVINYPKRGLGKTAISHILSGNRANLTPAALKGLEDFESTLSDIAHYCQDHSPSEVITYVIERSGIRRDLRDTGTDGAERLLNIDELVSYATKFDTLQAQEDDGQEYVENPWEHMLEHMLEHIALMSDQDTLDQSSRQNAVRLMTIHAAKGLEFDVVFITGLEQGLFPSDVIGEEKERDPEEERRLMYVAVTRAKKKLYLSYAHTRMVFGKTNVQIPSEFIGDISEDLLEYQEGMLSDGLDDITTVYLDF